MTASVPERDLDVLQNKRDATRYQILVEIADRQPAVSQQEIADVIGVTAQAISDYLRDLRDRGHVTKHGRGRYEVTKEGVDWLISRTDDLRTYTRHVAEEVVGRVDVDTAIAAGDVETGQTVGLAMRDGLLHALPEDTEGATATAVTDAVTGTDVGVTDFEGLLDYDPGDVSIVTVPPVRDGGSRELDAAALDAEATAHDLVVADGAEAVAACRQAGIERPMRFGAVAAAREAATRGLTVLVVVVESRITEHTDTFREAGLQYEPVDLTE